MSESVIDRIDKEIEKRSLLKNKFYTMWSEGKLTLDHLSGYSKEYYQLVKTVPKFVENIITGSDKFYDECKKKNTSLNNKDIENFGLILKEEEEHIEPWKQFSESLNVNKEELDKYDGDIQVKSEIEGLLDTSISSFEEAVASMYALEKEIPKISRSKINGLKDFYGLTDESSIKYFEIHEKADVIHANVWKNIMEKIPAEYNELMFNAAVKSLEHQNGILDAIYSKYVKVNS